ncbi:MAG: hypothetical protein KF875_01625 [Trueperaceae bacterium]|nr:hypothetical protein [Trueperaceae bacterium]MCC6312159.1 hypothetical protein [Trueperaceae bacterium]MCO5172814.1 hypothetical protein [Trueperaceae bacterium]MCW5820382.1 hypothetical protein [Trueperaceae bacterium]
MNVLVIAVERLDFAWIQAKRGITGSARSTHADDLKAVSKPSGRTRTPLTDSDVDATRTTRAQGVSMITLARRFGVHRGTVWVKTR